MHSNTNTLPQAVERPALDSGDLFGEERRRLTAQILSGFAANPAVFASRPDCGWSLCNCTDEDLVGYALSLADKVMDGDRITAGRKALEEIEREATGALNNAFPEDAPDVLANVAGIARRALSPNDASQQRAKNGETL